MTLKGTSFLHYMTLNCKPCRSVRKASIWQSRHIHLSCSLAGHIYYNTKINTCHLKVPCINCVSLMIYMWDIFTNKQHLHIYILLLHERMGYKNLNNKISANCGNKQRKASCEVEYYANIFLTTIARGEQNICSQSFHRIKERKANLQGSCAHKSLGQRVAIKVQSRRAPAPKKKNTSWERHTHFGRALSVCVVAAYARTNLIVT